MSNYALVTILMLRFVIPYASTKVTSYAMKFISYLWCIIWCMLSAWVRDFSLLCWSLLNPFASLNFCTKYDHYLCIQNPLNQFCHMSPPYLPIYMLYFRAVLRKFVCAISNFQNIFPFCVLVPLMKRQGVANIFNARCVILKMSVYSLVIA